MYEFRYHRPGTVRQAANFLAKNEDAKVIAGGHTLIPVMKQRLASPPHLVDLSHIEGLNTIEMKGRSLVIGATARHADVANSPIVGEAIPALAELAGMIMTAVDLVHRRGHDLSEQVIREELEGNLCRCTGYHNIVKAVLDAAKVKGATVAGSSSQPEVTA